MCKTATHEINENRHDIIEIKGHLGLSADPYHELLEFDDPFAEWMPRMRLLFLLLMPLFLAHVDALVPLLVLVALLLVAKRFLM
jgi:hypothetical protein